MHFLKKMLASMALFALALPASANDWRRWNDDVSASAAAGGVAETYTSPGGWGWTDSDVKLGTSTYAVDKGRYQAAGYDAYAKGSTGGFVYDHGGAGMLSSLQLGAGGEADAGKGPGVGSSAELDAFGASEGVGDKVVINQELSGKVYAGGHDTKRGGYDYSGGGGSAETSVKASDSGKSSSFAAGYSESSVSVDID